MHIHIGAYWWVDSIQVRSECPLPPIALSPLCLSSSVPSLLPFRQPGIPVSLAMPHQLFGVGLATPPRKKYSQPPTRLEAEVGVGAIGAGEPLATAPIQICWGVRPCRPLGCQATRGACLPVCRMQEPAGALCPETGGRTP